MFSATSALLKKRDIPAYGMFMKKMKNDPRLKACTTIAARGKLTAKLYNLLSDAEKAALKKAGKR